MLLSAYAVMTACGGRSTLVDDTGFIGEGGDDGQGGTSGTGGSAPNGGTYNPAGGSSGRGAAAGRFGQGGFGGRVGTGGTTGYPGGFAGAYAGTYFGGQAGSYPAGFGGSGGTGIYTGGYAGVLYPAGSGGSIYPGGFGGAGGSVYPGGFGGTFGMAGAGGTNPNVRDSCAIACKNMSPTCLQGTSVEQCYASCVEIGDSSPWCAAEFSDYVYCLGSEMWPDASCSYVYGSCNGSGCTQDAADGCSGWADRYDRCLTGNCEVSRVDNASHSCMLVTTCTSVTYRTDCYAGGAAAGYWACYCYADGELFSGTVAPATGGDTCFTGAALCGIPRGL